ncbi:GNAT family N-acetyltransferase [Halobacillus dabanensis]|uniref:GNAT family N-acetyltransferase n=1 Tax=Halobacillus dabanensis TaxID=240302 RepID=UPI001FC94ADF|nr:GNAT family N-acetyltransferase [Halobacillus dabanensis]
MNEANAQAVIQEEKEYFKQLKQPFEWKLFSYDSPSNLKSILLDEGFEEEEEEALLVLDVRNAASLLYMEEQEQLVEVDDEHGVSDIISLMDDIWGEDHSALGKRLWRDKQAHPDHLYLYGIYDGEELISGAWMYLEEGTSFASLWGGATRPSYRGRGLYKDLIAARAKKAAEKGYIFLTVDARPMSRPILEKNGFQCLAYTYAMQSPK